MTRNMKRAWLCACLLPWANAVPAAASAAPDGAATGMVQPTAAQPGTPQLRVCADPANLPYSSRNQEGFENKIADLLAADMHRELRYTWDPQRKTFFRRTLLAGKCDVVISVPAILPVVATTKPIFSSSYVIVQRSNDPHRVVSLDDPYLRDARIGIQSVGLEGINTPPAMALGKRNLVQHLTGYQMWAEEGVTNPQGRIIDAVANGQIDVALVWGPFAGYFAKPYGDKLHLRALTGDSKLPDIAFTYAMAMGVRKSDVALRDMLQDAIDRHLPEIVAILEDFHIPLTPVSPQAITQTQTH